MADVEKELKKEEKKVEKSLKNVSITIRKNPWIFLSVVLAIALVAVLVWPRGMTGNAAADKLVIFLNSQVVEGGGVSLKSVQSKGDLYEVTVLYQDQEIPLYITKDGNYFVQRASEIPDSSSVTGQAVGSQQNSQQAPTEVPKSEKPKAEVFVFSYCPYGLQFEKALLPVYNLLKNKADINIVAIGAMHGPFEKTESLRQLCIQKNYGKDKLWSYLDNFIVSTDIGNCRGDDACLEPLINSIYTKIGVDKNKVNSCMKTDAEDLYNADNLRANELGVSGSPTFVINGVQVSVGRSPEEIKTAICSAFETEPSECSTTLSAEQATPSFGVGSSSSSSAASCNV